MGLKELSSRDIVGRFFERLESAGSLAWISQVSMLFPTDQETENYKWLGFSPSLRQWVGGRQKKGVRVNGVSITNVIYESTLGISVDDKRRDKSGQIDIRIAEMVDDAINHWSTLLSTLIINGETSLCYDGQAFFDTDHTEGDSGTQTNDLSGSDYSELSAVTTPTNPTADELANVIVKMIQHVYSLKNDQGRPMNQRAQNFLLMVPVPFYGNAVKAVYGQTLNVGTGVTDNPVAALRNRGISIEVVANPELTWTTKMALFRTDGNAKPLIRQVELLDGRKPSEADIAGE
jgi:hypothetical protein